MSASNGVTGPAERAREVEVVAKAMRRRFTAEYKHQVLREADACTKPGEIGALLRREGLYFLEPQDLAGPAAERGTGRTDPEEAGPHPRAQEPTYLARA